MSVREKIKQQKASPKQKSINVEKILKNCREEYNIEGLQLCDLEECELYKSTDCDEWKQWDIDDDLIEELFG